MNDSNELNELDELLGDVELQPMAKPDGKCNIPNSVTPKRITKSLTEHSAFKAKAIANYKSFMSDSFREFGYGLAKRTNLRLDYLKIITNHIYQGLIEKERDEKRRRIKKSKSVSAV